MKPVVSPEELFHAEGWVLLDARPGVEAYAAGHLAGAFHADLNTVLSCAAEPGFDPARGGRHPLPDPTAWARQLGAWGIRPGTPVVVYDDARGGNGGARAWWMLRASGHEAVALLDGGLQAAQEAGLPLSQEPPTSHLGEPYPVKDWGPFTASLEEVDRLRLDPDWVVIDVRAPERWRGEVEPFDPVPGRIPGSRNLPFVQNLDEQGRLKSPEALREHYLQALGPCSPEQVIVSCGSGVTACHTLLALEHAGLPGARLYVGSYSEWCRTGRPVQ